MRLGAFHAKRWILPSLPLLLFLKVLCGSEVRADTNEVPGFKIVSFGLAPGAFTANIQSATGAVYSLQAASDPRGYWVEITNQPGNGGTLSLVDTTLPASRFYRVAGISGATFTLFPTIPPLPSGAISLPDAVTGQAYATILSPLNTGTGPYNLQLSNSPPGGLTATVISNNTPNALVRVTSAGTNLTAGLRGQFTVTASDSAGMLLSRSYDVRIVAPPPQISTTQLVFKAGAATNEPLIALHGTAPLQWSLLSGFLPTGLTLTTNGSLKGTPTADDAETNETGLFTNVIAVADSYTERVTGQPQPRTIWQTNSQLVRLSYRLNLLPSRPGGPHLQGACLECHGTSFPPNFLSSSATSVIYVSAGSGGDCSSTLDYVIPQDLADSLLYLKLANPICGKRMPDGGPYLDDQQINRVARWILELTFTDTD